MKLLRTRGLWPAALLLSGCMSGADALTEGKAAPPTAGVDVGGEPRQLSDYQGRVVLLDFWRTA